MIGILDLWELPLSGRHFVLMRGLNPCSPFGPSGLVFCPHARQTIPGRVAFWHCPAAADRQKYSKTLAPSERFSRARRWAFPFFFCPTDAVPAGIKKETKKSRPHNRLSAALAYTRPGMVPGQRSSASKKRVGALVCLRSIIGNRLLLAT